jgi:hypothetical protein
MDLIATKYHLILGAKMGVVAKSWSLSLGNCTCRYCSIQVAQSRYLCKFLASFNINFNYEFLVHGFLLFFLRRRE